MNNKRHTMITYTDGKAIEHLHYLPYGETQVDQRATSHVARYTFSAKEKDEETGYSVTSLRSVFSLQFGNLRTSSHCTHLLRRFGARYYNSDLSIWLSVDPMSDKYPSLSPYAYCANNPVILVDPDGERPFPLFNTYHNWHITIASWFGNRNIGLKGASKYHRGIDFNYSGGENTDYGAPILSTHEGTATMDNDPSGGEGRSIIITSPDGNFRTRYFHLSKINIKNGQYVSESNIIGEMGGSANGNNFGRTSHLHYEIQILQNGKWVSINPTENKGNNMTNILDPQKWISSDNRLYYYGILPVIAIKKDNTPINDIQPSQNTEKSVQPTL